MKVAKKFFFLIAFFCLIACKSKFESPVVYLSNYSSEPIKNIECNWAGKHVLSLPNLNPGDSRSQSFMIKKDADFFGENYISWYNSHGDKLVKNFTLREHHLPSIHDKDVYSYIQLYFSQGTIEVVSSDAPDIAGKTTYMDRMMEKHRYDFKTGQTPVVDNSLIMIREPKRDKTVPAWLGSAN